MDNHVHMDLTVQEMRHLAEICAMTLSTIEPLRDEYRHDIRYAEWQQLCISILGAANQIPELAPHVVFNQQHGYCFFTPAYIQHSFYADLINKTQDSIFWSELVSRMGEEVFGAAHLQSPAESQQRTMYEQSLWQEVEKYGLSRFRIQH